MLDIHKDDIHFLHWLGSDSSTQFLEDEVGGGTTTPTFSLSGQVGVAGLGGGPTSPRQVKARQYCCQDKVKSVGIVGSRIYCETQHVWAHGRPDNDKVEYYYW